jgi:uncharacterized tellurite resistance protein B-like protein
MSLAKLFGFAAPRETTTSPEDTETIRKITRALDSMEPEQAKFLAAFAFILSRAARADLHISEAETKEIERLVCEVGGLPAEQAVLVVQIAKTQNVLFGGTENFLVTQEFNRLATREQKLGLLHCMFAVSAADQSVSSVEDHVVRTVARELQLTHDDYISVRLSYKQHLAVLKKPNE